MKAYQQTKPWSEYPIGTKVHAIMGGHWIKTETGYKWCSGATFPAPGADWHSIEEPKRNEK